MVKICAVVLVVVLGSCGVLSAQQQEAEQAVRDVPRQTLDPADLELEEDLETAVTVREAEETAVELRENPRAYMTRLSAGLEVPQPLADWDAAVQVFPGLAESAGWLREALSGDGVAVSPLFYALYEAKARWLQERSVVFHDLPDAAHFYDLDGAWTIPAPDPARSGQPVLVFQGRFGQRGGTHGYDKAAAQKDPALDYRPATTWRWPREGDPPTDLVEASRHLLKLLEEEYAIVGLPRKRNRQLEAGLAARREELQLFEKWQYLDSRETPFVVFPEIYRQFAGETAAPEIGDPVVVIVGDRVIPAVFGDETADPGAGEFSPRIWDLLNLPEDQDQDQVQAMVLVFPRTGQRPPVGPPEDLAELTEDLRKRLATWGAPEGILQLGAPGSGSGSAETGDSTETGADVFAPATD